MLNKLPEFMKRYDMVQPGEELVCAVSGGADSVALLFAMYLLRDKLKIRLSAAHFNHGLRGAESDRDEAFVREFCDRYEIPLYCGSGRVTAGKKGLEAAARTARYEFFAGLPGKLATAHTADDNAETVLMHMVRGTGLKGLGGIMPQNGKVIRPMLSVTREEVLAFLEEYHVTYVQDSSNDTDAFLRNRLRHHVMPLLKQENPRLAQSMSDMALRLRQDEEALHQEACGDVNALRQMSSSQRSRAIGAFLEKNGIKEPAAEHIALAESLVFSEKPSAKASFPGGITLCRNYDKLEVCPDTHALTGVVLNCPGSTDIPQLQLRVICPEGIEPKGTLWLRARQPGDEMRLSGGTKSLKKLFIDRKIPANMRLRIPVIADDMGVLAVYGVGMNLDRSEKDGPQIRFENM